MPSKNAMPVAAAAPEFKPGQSPADQYYSWLSGVVDALRKAFHSDTRLIEDATIKAGSKILRAALEAAEPKDRFALAVQWAMSKEPPTLEVEESAAVLFKKRREVRDHLCVMAGKRDAEEWDDLWYRVCADLRLVDMLGRELVRLGAMHRKPNMDPYASKSQRRNTAMAGEPSAAEDAFAGSASA